MILRFGIVTGQSVQLTGGRQAFANRHADTIDSLKAFRHHDLKERSRPEDVGPVYSASVGSDLLDDPPIHRSHRLLALIVALAVNVHTMVGDLRIRR
jgi:hypothetical protein